MPLLIMRGKALFELERLEEAKTAFDQAVTAGKSLEARSLTEAHLGLAIIATRTKDYPSAKTQFTKLIALNPRDVHARINLARVCLQAGDMKCAIEHGEQAGRMKGNAEDVLFTLGRIYTVAKKYDDAEKTFQHICDIIPKASSCPYGVALVAAQKGDKAKALAKLKEAVALKLPHPEKLAEDPLLAPLKDDEDFKKLASKP